MDFLTRISVTCFAASYAVGMANEVLRIFWPARWVRWVTTAWAAAGLLAQTLYLLALAIPERRLPIENQFESLITVSWCISLVYFYLLVRDRRLASGLFILPISLGLVCFAALYSDRGPSTSLTGRPILAAAHGLLLLAGTVVVLFATVAALMYLVKVRQLKRGTHLASIRLPSLERLDHVHGMAVHVAWPLLTIGILLGIALWKLEFTDPKFLTTVAAWLLFTVLVHRRYQPDGRGRKLAILTVVACAMVLVSLLGDPLFGTLHQSNSTAAVMGNHL